LAIGLTSGKYSQKKLAEKQIEKKEGEEDEYY
jgi:hypothetical protein